MKNSKLVLLLLGCLFSCQTKKPAAGLNETINIDLTEAVAKQLPAEEWIEEVQFIPLETNLDCYLSSASRYNLNSEFIVFYADQKIHLFNRQGKHLKSFQSICPTHCNWTTKAQRPFQIQVKMESILLIPALVIIFTKSVRVINSPGNTVSVSVIPISTQPC